MVWKMTTHELLTRYRAGERNFAGVELITDYERNIYDASGEIHGLEGSDLRGINLRGAKLQRVVLEGTNLTEADLSGACLFCANLCDGILKGSNLYAVCLLEAFCKGTNFDGAYLSLMNAMNTNFVSAIITKGFENAILAHANFKGSGISKYTLCSYGNFIYCTTMSDGTIESGSYHGQW